VGNSLAGRIEEYRREHGPFASVNDLRQVNGIGPMILERLRPWLRVQDPDSEGAAALYRVTGPSPAMQASRSAASSGKVHGSKSPGKKEADLTEPVDLNQATETELQRLPGIGPRRARLIIDEREKRPFASIDELRRVPGIGPKTLEKLRPHITVESARPPPQINPELGSQRKAGGAELGRDDQKKTA
jgi:competence protein ComEA